MSTNQTSKYGLHLWEPGDDFLRTEFNDNFAALDDAARIVCGTYTGDGAASQFIPLGFTPKAVLVVPQDGYMTYYAGGLAFQDHPAGVRERELQPCLSVEEGGFRVYYHKLSPSMIITLNGLDLTRFFLAVR